MHDYSIDRHPKEKVLFFLALLAILITPQLNKAAAHVVAYFDASTGWSIPLAAIPVFALFGGIYFIFDQYLWKWKWARRILLVPDLNGVWACTGLTTLKNGEAVSNEWIGTITITQSWSKISIRLKTPKSGSIS
jgi:SMODS-associating 2TM, beta-strand rich effector domain